MKIRIEDVQQLKQFGIYVTERCDGDDCGKILNQSFRYTIQGRKEVFCSAECRDLVFKMLRRRGDLKVGIDVPAAAVWKPVVKSDSPDGTIGHSKDSRS